MTMSAEQQGQEGDPDLGGTLLDPCLRAVGSFLHHDLSEKLAQGSGRRGQPRGRHARASSFLLGPRRSFTVWRRCGLDLGAPEPAPDRAGAGRLVVSCGPSGAHQFPAMKPASCIRPLWVFSALSTQAVNSGPDMKVWLKAPSFMSWAHSGVARTFLNSSTK